MYAFAQFFCTTLAGTGMLIVAKEWSTDAVFLTTSLIIFSFYLQSLWTEGRRLAKWLEWFKLALVLILSVFLPLNPAMLVVLQAYLVISFLSLVYLTVQSATRAK